MPALYTELASLVCRLSLTDFTQNPSTGVRESNWDRVRETSHPVLEPRSSQWCEYSAVMLGYNAAASNRGPCQQRFLPPARWGIKLQIRVRFRSGTCDQTTQAGSECLDCHLYVQ